MKIKGYFITVLVCIFTLLFATNFVFAGNIGRAVYGVYTETYNGVGINNASAGNDNVLVYAGGSISEPWPATDKFEGEKYYQFGSGGWVSFAFAGGAQNMSDYTRGRLYFSANVGSDISENLNLVYIKIQDSGGAKYFPFNNSNIKRVGSSSTGVLADGNWHSYYIDLSSFVSVLGLNLNNITNPFVFSTDAPGTVLVDYVYWTKAPDATRAFNVVVKNISDNQVLTGDNEKITWTQAAYRQSWTAAEQYIELDLDRESYNEIYNWYVKIYLNNGKASRNGLYCIDSDGSEIVLPMAWRMRPDLVSSNNFTLLIGKNGDDGLYDRGLDPGGTDWYTWSPIKEINDKTVEEYDYVTIWNLKGIHTVVKYHDAYDPLSNYEKKPKIYFAADCSNAIGGLEYEANVVTELVYE